MKFLPRALCVALVAMVAVLAFAPMASANWTGSGDSVLSAATTSFTINGSATTLTCTTANASFVVPNPPSSSISTAAGSLKFNGCSVDAVPTPNAKVVVTSSGTPITVTAVAKKNATTWAVVITLPTVLITLTVGGSSCTIPVPSNTSIGGSFSTDTHSLAIDNDFTVVVSGPPCSPTAGNYTATFTGIFTDKTLGLV